MEEAKTVLLAVVIAIVAGAAIFTSIDVFLALSNEKAARCRKPKYFNIMFRPGHGTEFYRARLVGEIDRISNKAIYLIEIHPKDAAKARAWAVQETGLCGWHLVEKGKFYKFAFKEALYD